MSTARAASRTSRLGLATPSQSDEAAALDELAEVVFRTDAAGNWTYLNPAWTRLTGLAVKDSLGSNFLDYVHPDEVEHTIALFQAVFAGGADHCHHVTRYRTADGSYRWVELRSRVLRAEDGTPTGNAGVLLDVTERRQTEETVTEHGHLLELLAGGTSFDDLPVGVAVYDHRLTVRQESPMLTRLLGPSMAVGSPIGSLYERLAEGAAEGVNLDGEWGLVSTVLRTGRPQYGDLQVRLPPEGNQLAFHVSVFPLTPAGDASGAGDAAFALVVHDVSDLRRAERQQAAVAALGQRALTGVDLATLLDEAAEVVTTTLAMPYCLVLELLGGGDGLLPRAAAGWMEGARSLGTIAVDDRSVLGRTVAGVSPTTTEDVRGVAPGKADAWLAEHGVAGCATVIIGGGWRTFGVLAVGTAGPRSFAPDEVNFLAAIANVLAAAIERHRAEEQTRHQALHDPLTGLANRVLLDDRLRQALHARRRRGGQSALLLMDLDRFKEINDTLGHPAGDRVLRLVGARLLEATRDTDTVARLGGDEFAVILPDVDIDDALAVADKLQSRVATVIASDGVALHVEGSIGIAMAPQHGDDPVTLLKRADVAMYRAKQLSVGVSTYSSENDHNGVGRVTYSAALRRGIDEDQLVLHYQPKIDLRTGRMTGVEALVRWQHPSFGLVEPDDFIPLAERTGLIRPLTRRVLTLALAQARRWQDQGRVLPVAVNVSALVLHDGDLVALVEQQLRSAGLGADMLELELTESAVMAYPSSGLSVVTRLRDAGVRLSIDDFGTGYSSLAYLRKLPVHELKIDRSFIREMTSSDTDVAIVRSVIELGHNLGLRVLGEGIESAAALRALEDLGCDSGQGYYLGRPVPPDQLA